MYGEMSRLDDVRPIRNEVSLVCIDAILGDYRPEAKMINELVKEAEQKHQRNN